METTTETTTKKKTHAPYGAIDKRYLTELQLAEELVQAAQAPPHTAALADGGITTAELQHLAETIASCRLLFTGSVDEKVQRKSATSDESATEAKLRRLIRGVQTAARLKYSGLPGADSHLAHYYIGERITLSRASLATYSAGILQKLETDTLPGISPARIAELTSTFESWKAHNAAQAAAQEAASQRRQEGIAQLETIKEGRRRIQRAADVVFPVGDPDYFATRAAFRLESNKPFRG